jgi:hypothetical protein
MLHRPESVSLNKELRSKNNPHMGTRSIPATSDTAAIVAGLFQAEQTHGQTYTVIGQI